MERSRHRRTSQLVIGAVYGGLLLGGITLSGCTTAEGWGGLFASRKAPSGENRAVSWLKQHKLSSPVAAPGQDVKLTKKHEADMKIAMGQMHESHGQPNEALVAYREAIRLDPGRGDAYLRMAMLEDQQGNFGEAIQMYQKAVKADPKNPNVFCNLGYSYYLQENWQDAEEQYRRALKLDPNHQRTHNNLGMLLARTERQKDAFAEFTKAGCTEDQAFCNLAFAETMQEHLEEAQRFYQLAQEANPSSQDIESRLHELDVLCAKQDDMAAPPVEDVQIIPVGLKE